MGIPLGSFSWALSILELLIPQCTSDCFRHGRAFGTGLEIEEKISDLLHILKCPLKADPRRLTLWKGAL
jgi:hypothetical protein